MTTTKTMTQKLARVLVIVTGVTAFLVTALLLFLHWLEMLDGYEGLFFIAPAIFIASGILNNQLNPNQNSGADDEYPIVSSGGFDAESEARKITMFQIHGTYFDPHR